MFTRIQVPLDGSRFSEFAVPVAKGLAARVGASLHLVTVAAAEGDEREAATREGERYLEAALVRMGGRRPDLPVSQRVLDGGPVVEALRTEAEEMGADLIVMTTHGRGGLQRAWFGSVAEGMVRSSERPVLLVRPMDGSEGEEDPLERVAAPFQRVLVPLDGSQVAERALKTAEALAACDGATLHLLRVVHPVMASTYPFRSVPTTGGSEGEEESTRHAEKYLEDRAATLRAGGVATETEVRVSTHPAMAVLDSVRETEADLVTMTTRGHGGAARLLLGSVADKVARGAEVPVLLHRTDAPEGSA